MAIIRIQKIKNETVDLEIPLSPAVSILNNILRAGITKIKHQCGGKAQCGTCRFQIISGETNLSPIEEREESLLRKMNAAPDTRLGCQSYAFNTIEIAIP